MPEYRIFSQEENKKVFTLCETNETIYVSQSKEKLIKKLQQEECNNLFFSYGEETYELCNLIKVLIKVKKIGSFCFFFNEDFFDIDNLKNEVQVLEAMDCFDDEAKTKKVFEMLNIVMKFKPKFAFCDVHFEKLFEYNFCSPFLLVMKASPKDKEEILFQKKEDKRFDLLFSFFTPCIVFAIFFGILDMCKKGSPYFFILIICELINLFSFGYYTIGRCKDKNNYSIFSKENKYWYICNLAGIIIGFLICFLYGKIRYDANEINEILLFALYSLIFTIGFIVLAYALPFLLHLYSLKKETKKVDNSLETIEKESINEEQSTFENENKASNDTLEEESIESISDEENVNIEK